MASKRYVTGGYGGRPGFPRTNLSAFDDVDIQGATPGEGLVWNGMKWENMALPSGGGNNITLFLHSSASPIADTKKLEIYPENGAGATITAAVSSASPVLLQAWVTDSLKKTSIPGGVWDFTLFGGVDVATGNTHFRVDLIVVAADGSNRRAFFSKNTEALESAVIHPIELTVVNVDFTPMLNTDRLMLEIYAVTDQVTPLNISLKYDSLTAQSRFDTPFIVNHDDLPGIDIAGSVKLHMPTLTVQSGDLTGAYPNPDIRSDLKDGDPAVPCLRSLGTLSDQAAAGNHNHDSIRFWLEPVISFYNNYSGAPVDPEIGDRYIAIEPDYGWVRDYIYEWNGSVWLETIPLDGDAVTVKSTIPAIWTYKTGESGGWYIVTPNDHHVEVTNSDINPSSLDNKIYAGNGISKSVITYLSSERLQISAAIGTLSSQVAVGNDTRFEKVKTSVTDPTPGYLVAKLEAGMALALTEDVSIPATPRAKFSVNFGTLSDQACVGNDIRLSNSRPPTAHDLAGSLHNADTLTNLNAKLSDGDVISTKAAEISALTPKTSPIAADLLMIEDSAAGNAKKVSTVSQILTNETDPVFLTRATTAAHYTGFPNRTASTLSFTDGTIKFAISGAFDIYVNGNKYSPATAAQLEVPVPNVTGLYWIWYTIVAGVPTLNASVSSPGFGVCLVATVYWNAATAKGSLSDERHWMGRDRLWHEYCHETIGCRFALGLAGTFTNTTFSVAAGEVYDEDIEHIITPAQTVLDCFYKSGTTAWVWDVSNVNPYKLNGSSMRYNNVNALADVPDNNYAVVWIFATNKLSNPLISIIGQRVDVNIANCRSNNTPESLVLGSLPAAEMKLLYRVIYRQTGASVVYQETTDYRTASILPVTNYTPTDHAALAHLDYTNANHTGFITNAAAEISAVTNKASPTTSDLLLIEDAADTNKKKNITIGALPAAAPATHDLAGALHNADTITNLNTKLSDGDVISTKAGEINALTEKTFLGLTDAFMIEDAADGYAKKKLLSTSIGKPSRIDMFPWGEGDSVGNWSLYQESTAIMCGWYYNTAKAQNDYVLYKIATAAGSWKIKLLFVKELDGGRCQPMIDDVNKGTYADMYGVESFDNELTIDMGALTGGYHDLKLKAATKHASSTAYCMRIQSISMWRYSA
jgi:hypothetical protein